MTNTPKNNISLAPLTTLNIGGPARHFVRADTEGEIVNAIGFAAENDLPLLILGGGSNVLIADSGFDGVVVQIAIRGIEMLDKENRPIHVTAKAGEDWDAFVGHCVSHDLAGVECLSGIPGLVGATPVQNVGAYGQEVSETIVAVRCFDRRTGKIVELLNTDCGFTYRTSIFNSTKRDRYVVLSVTFALTPQGDPKVVYKDLIEHFAGGKPSLAEVRNAVLKIRRSKSMVIDPEDPNSKSAGSFFKNPVVEVSKLDDIRSSFAEVPHFEFGDMVKIPAAWLIEQAGFHKGFVMGNAGISSKHTLALINRGGATAAEILRLKDAIQAEVAARFGIDLVPEPVLAGFIAQGQIGGV